MSDKIELNKELKLKALEIISKAANYQSILAEADRTGSGSIRTSNLCMHIKFKDDFFKFYIETCGQKGHYIVPYIGNGQEIKNEYIIKRNLFFVGIEDEGKQGAVLGVLDLNKCNLIGIVNNIYQFDLFDITIYDYL